MIETTDAKIHAILNDNETEIKHKGRGQEIAKRCVNETQKQ